MDEGVSYRLDQEEFMMAFAFETTYGKIIDFDSRYVRWVSRTWEQVGDQSIIKYYPLHPCTEQEMSEFVEAEND